MKNRYVAIFLAFFFGWAGAHKFYLEKTYQGILHCITPPLGWFFAIYEAVMLLKMTNEDFEYFYNKEVSDKALVLERQKLMRQQLINERKSLERELILEDKRFKKELKKQKAAPKPMTGEMADHLAAWHDLKEQGIISEFEYEAKRKEILYND